ncbi:MAG: hypothetical protein ACK4QL_07820 [Pseudanabaenaceae cyanobacterium]
MIITNWKQVGGPDLKIQPYGKLDRGGDPRFGILAETTTELIKMVSEDPRGIYGSSASLLVPQCGIKRDERFCAAL